LAITGNIIQKTFFSWESLKYITTFIQEIILCSEIFDPSLARADVEYAFADALFHKGAPDFKEKLPGPLS